MYIHVYTYIHVQCTCTPLALAIFCPNNYDKIETSKCFLTVINQVIQTRLIFRTQANSWHSVNTHHGLYNTQFRGAALYGDESFGGTFFYHLLLHMFFQQLHVHVFRYTHSLHTFLGYVVSFCSYGPTIVEIPSLLEWRDQFHHLDLHTRFCNRYTLMHSHQHLPVHVHVYSLWSCYICWFT